MDAAHEHPEQHGFRSFASYKIADGAGTNFNITTSLAESSAIVTYLITGWSEATAPEIATPVAATVDLPIAISAGASRLIGHFAIDTYNQPAGAIDADKVYGLFEAGQEAQVTVRAYKL